MASETEVIRQEMEGTRSSLSEKLGMLEAQVTEKVAQATTTVADTVEAVSATVGSVQETVADTVDAVKQTFDLPGHADRHPWMVFGGAVLLGFVGARILTPPRVRWPRHWDEPPRRSRQRPPVEDKAEAEKPSGGILGSLGLEVDNLKKVGVGMAMSVLREVVAAAVPVAVGPTIASAVNALTHKLGGEVFEQHESEANSGQDRPHKNGHHEDPSIHDEPLAGRRW